MAAASPPEPGRIESARSTKRPFGVLVPGRLLVDPYKADTFIRVLAEIWGYGRLRASPTGHMRSSGYLRKTGVTGGFYPPLQGICAHPGACKNPGLRADTLSRVLAENRGYGRLRASPTGRVQFCSRAIPQARTANREKPKHPLDTGGHRWAQVYSGRSMCMIILRKSGSSKPAGRR